MKRFIVFLIVAVIGMVDTVFAAETQLPAGTFVFSDDDNYFGRMTIGSDGAFTGTLRETFDEAEYGRRTFRGRLSFGGEVDCLFSYPQATYYRYPFAPSETLTIRHTPDGPTAYVAVVVVSYGNRIGPPTVITYELPSYRVLEDPSAAGFYTMLFRAAPATFTGKAPAGTGWAVLRLSEGGSFRCVGKLANNESFSFGFDARADRKLDLVRFQSPATFYPRRGGHIHSEFYGTITLRDVANVSDADGTVMWRDILTAETEFVTDLPVIASRYVPTRDALSALASDPAPGLKRPLGMATFSHDSFAEPKSALFRFGAQALVLPDSRRLMPTLRWQTQAPPFPGRFHGQVRPGGERTFPFSGVFFSKQHIAEGFFRIPGDSGVVRLGIKSD